mmetsp:Transcript_19852/g.41440  ORF Transcript_19852/g.41440 Transcript_19852/m.41440 type:complete len:183 (+) Transcript_19852:115-663(+)
MSGKADDADVPLLSQKNTILERYNRALDASPLLTKSLTSAVISGAGAALGSKLTTKRISWVSVFAFAMHGGLVNGPVGHYWFKWLDENVKSPGKAMVLDQLLIQPPLCALMFVLLDCFSAAIKEMPKSILRTRTSVGGVIVNSWKFWPFAVLLTVKYLKQKYHTLSLNLASLLWTCYLSKSR